MEKTQLIEAMEKIVGKEHVLHSPEALYEYSYDATPGHSYMPDVVVSPGTVQEVSEIMNVPSTLCTRISDGPPSRC